MIARILAVMAALIVATATPAGAVPVPDPAEPRANSPHGYVSPSDPDYACTYQRLGSYEGLWCIYAPGNGATTGKHLVPKRATVWWNPWTWLS